MLLAVEGGGQDRDRLAGAKEGRSQGVVLLKKKMIFVLTIIFFYIYFLDLKFFFLFFTLHLASTWLIKSLG